MLVSQPFRGVLSRPFRQFVVAGSTAYLLQATFDAVNQGFADAQVLDTTGEGVQAGQLTVNETDGTLAIVSNECAFTAQSTPVWGDLGLVGEISGGGGFTRAIGLALMGTFNLSAWEEMGVGWHSAAAVVDPDSAIYAIQSNTTLGRIDNGNGDEVIRSLNLNTDYQFALVLGGYDVNGISYRDGDTKAAFVYGVTVYYKGDAFGDWRFLWTQPDDNIATLYALFSSLDAVGTLNDFRIPDSDLSAIFQPINFSSFTAANGTSLDAITPEIGSAWSEEAGVWDIQSNRANLTAGVGLSAAALIDTGITEGTISCVVNTQTRLTGIHFRWVDVNNYWILAIDTTDNELQLWEVFSGGFTKRASASVALSNNTDYTLLMIIRGNYLAGFVDYANGVSLVNSRHNTATKHGIRARDAGDRIDNFVIKSSNAAIYDTLLDGV